MPVPEVHRVTMLDPAALQRAPYNPRRIAKRQLDALVLSIQQHGFVEPIVVQASTRTIIGGHQRVEALRRLCAEQGAKLPKIPAVLLDVDDRQARRLNVALNRIAGEWDDAALASLVASLGALAPEEAAGMGLSDAEVAAMLAPAEPAEDESTTFAASVTLSIRFDTVEERDATKALLDERANREHKRPGTVLRELLA